MMNIEGLNSISRTDLSTSVPASIWVSIMRDRGLLGTFQEKIIPASACANDKEKAAKPRSASLLVMRVSVCARSAIVAQRVVNALSAACCFTSIKQNPRDELKAFRGSRPIRDGATDFGWGVSAVEDAADDDGDPGSGDEDVLTSLGASYRAWRAYHREKRAHDYTKSRLVDAIRHETVLEMHLARFGGTAQGVERTLMRLGDLESTVVALEEKCTAVLAGQVNGDVYSSYGEVYAHGLHDQPAARQRLQRLQQQGQESFGQLGDADVTILHWQTRCQRMLSKLVECKREKEQLVGELRNVKKTAVLLANRQYVQLCSRKKAPQSLLRDAHQSQSNRKKRSYSDIAASEISAAV